MKQAFLLFLSVLVLPVLLFAQNKDSTIQTIYSAIQTHDTAVLLKDPVTVVKTVDSAMSNPLSLQRFLLHHKLINSSPATEAMQSSIKKQKSKDIIFYLLTGLMLMLAFFRYFYARYFSNLFRVFFNTSLRQSQLTDQLLQAKFPSLLFNLFFFFSGGFYIYSLLLYFNWIDNPKNLLIAGICIAAMGVIYISKYAFMKFTGWLTGYKEVVNTYLFILFLINKIVGVLLVPIIILMSFSHKGIVDVVVIISLLVIGFMFALRFYRAYGILQNQMKINKFHFFLYILGIELLPLLLIYKGLIWMLNKNL